MQCANRTSVECEAPLKTPAFIHVPHPHLLAGFEGIPLRVPPRPPHLRQDFYEERYDYHTVWYDGFRHKSGEWIILVGPPLLNLAAPYSAGRFSHNGGSKEAFYRDLWGTRQRYSTGIIGGSLGTYQGGSPGPTPAKKVFLASGRSGDGLEEWFRALTGGKTGTAEIIVVGDSCDDVRDTVED